MEVDAQAAKGQIERALNWIVVVLSVTQVIFSEIKGNAFKNIFLLIKIKTNYKIIIGLILKDIFYYENIQHLTTSHWENVLSCQ